MAHHLAADQLGPWRGLQRRSLQPVRAEGRHPVQPRAIARFHPVQAQRCPHGRRRQLCGIAMQIVDRQYQQAGATVDEHAARAVGKIQPQPGPAVRSVRIEDGLPVRARQRALGQADLARHIVQRHQSAAKGLIAQNTVDLAAQPVGEMVQLAQPGGQGVVGNRPGGGVRDAHAPAGFQAASGDTLDTVRIDDRARGAGVIDEPERLGVRTAAGGMQGDGHEEKAAAHLCGHHDIVRLRVKRDIAAQPGGDYDQKPAHVPRIPHRMRVRTHRKGWR